MTAEKYVNTVVKHVKCSKGKRREIKQQLLSDISAAEEQGEQTEEILRRMGNAKTQISDDWGNFQSWGSIYLSEVTQQGQTFAVGQATAVYEHVTVTYTISFDEDMKLAGLYMK